MKNEVNTKPEGYLPGDILFGNLREISEGELLCKLDDKFAALVAAVMNTGNKGSLTLQISVKRKGGVAQCEITPTVKASIPEASIPEASIPVRIMFADLEGNLYTSDPNQGQLDLESRPMRVLPNKPAPGNVVDVAAKAASREPAVVGAKG